jgi:ribosomal protein S18 acetylase RimI-like enzyme
MTSTVHVAPVDAHNRNAVLALSVHPAQLDYVGAIADMLADAEISTNSEPMAIVHDAAVVGYYRIERNASAVAGRSFAEPTLGLRSFFIDAAEQGKGLGRRALGAIFADLAVRHPEHVRLVLTVNCSNTPALGLYNRAGFEDSGELYHGGRAGPQQLLWRRLGA